MTDLELVSCSICGGTATSPYCTKFGLPLVRCISCGLVFANPRLNADAIEQRYYSPAYFRDEYLPGVIPPSGPNDSAFLDERYRRPLELLRSTVPNAGRLLEIGTGAGFFLKAGARAGWDAYGLEVSPEAVAYACDTLGLRVTRGRAEDVPFEAASFDAVAMFEVIEHLRDPARVLRAAHGYLRPGGGLIISTPNLHSFSRFALGTNWAVLSPAEHLYYFTEKTLRRLLVNAGFQRVRFVRDYHLLHFEAMNPRYTHALRSLRARMYQRLVWHAGSYIFRGIQAVGLGDSLVALAEA